RAEMNSSPITWALVATIPGLTRKPVAFDSCPMTRATEGSHFATIWAVVSGATPAEGAGDPGGGDEGGAFPVEGVGDACGGVPATATESPTDRTSGNRHIPKADHTLRRRARMACLHQRSRNPADQGRLGLGLEPSEHPARAVPMRDSQRYTAPS